MHQLKRIFLPFIVFSFFFILNLFDYQFLSQITTDITSLTYQYLNYAIHILFWIVTAVFLNRLLKIFLWERFANKTGAENIPQLLIDIVSLLVYIFAIIIIIGYVFQQPLTGLWATSGIVAIVLGLALRNIILDIFTGLAVNIEKPYRVGDWIQIHQRVPEQNVIGQVLEINWRATRIKTEKNAIVVIPNSVMSISLVTNFWIPNTENRQEVLFCIDFSVPEERVKRILNAAVGELLDHNGFVKQRPPEVLVKNTTELGVVYEVRFWINAWRVISPAQARDKINLTVLKHLRIAGISLAYPKKDIYYERMPARHFDTVSLSGRKKIIAGVELFAFLPEKELDNLAEQMRHFVFKSGESIVKSGDVGESMFIIVEGIADVLISENEKMVKVSQLHPGQFFGEMSLLTGEPRSADVAAVTDLVVYELHRDHLNKTIHDYPEIVVKISEILVERKYQNAQMLRELKEHTSTTLPENPRLLVKKIRAFFSGIKSTN